jgi:hypothetical protein
MKPEREPTLPAHCPHCQRVVYVAIVRLQTAVAVVCTSCHKSIAMTAEFVEAIAALK